MRVVELVVDRRFVQVQFIWVLVAMYGVKIRSRPFPPGRRRWDRHCKTERRQRWKSRAACLWPRGPPQLQSQRLYYGHVVDPASGKRVDECSSVTCGNRTAIPVRPGGNQLPRRRCPLQEILRLCLRQGARQAYRRIHLRAFLNGRIDLSQGRGGSRWIRAKTDTD